MAALPNYSKALGRRVVTVYQIETVLCCQLDGDLLVGAHFAVEHQDLEIIAGELKDLPLPFADPLCRLPHSMRFLLVGRRFRGFIDFHNGDALFNFGRYGIKYVRQTGLAHLAISIDKPTFWDLPEDAHLSISEQFAHAQNLARSAG